LKRVTCKDFANLPRQWLSHRKWGSKVLVIGRNESGIVAKAQTLPANSGLAVSEIFESKENMDYDEQASDLGDQLIKDRHPRVKWDSFWIIGAKE